MVTDQVVVLMQHSHLTNLVCDLLFFCWPVIVLCLCICVLNWTEPYK